MVSHVFYATVHLFVNEMNEKSWQLNEKFCLPQIWNDESSLHFFREMRALSSYFGGTFCIE